MTNNLNPNPAPGANPGAAPPAEPGRAYKFPAAKAVVDACIGNLSANMANPDAADAARDARDVARADPAPAVGTKSVDERVNAAMTPAPPMPPK